MYWARRCFVFHVFFSYVFVEREIVQKEKERIKKREKETKTQQKNKRKLEISYAGNHQIKTQT